MLLVLTALWVTQIAATTPKLQGFKPLMGWRSWEFYQKFISAQSYTDNGAMLANRSGVGGTSLCDLGYCDVGLDALGDYTDCATPDNGYTSHVGFCNMTAITSFFTSLGLTSSYYGYYFQYNASYGASQFDFGLGQAVAWGFNGFKLDGQGFDASISTHAMNRILALPVSSLGVRQFTYEISDQVRNVWGNVLHLIWLCLLHSRYFL